LATSLIQLLSRSLNLINPNLVALEDNLNSDDSTRLRQYRRFNNFYQGYHWQEVQTTDEDSPQVTQNWCRSFVDKFVAAEYNKGFTFKFDEDVEK
jgi:hypothetical protein